MNKRIILLATIIPLLLIPVIPAQAFDLPDAFDEPCMGGMGILADICNAINDLHDFVHGQEARIDSLNSTQITQQTQIDSLNATQITQQEEINANEALHIIQTTRLNSLNGTQILERIDQNIIEARLALIPSEILIKTLADTEDVDCEESPGVYAQGWCPDWPNQSLRNFNITDSDVTADSMISVATFGLNFVLPICTSTNTINDGYFIIHCPFPVNGTSLRYSIMNP